jgi:hypothetical protein
MNLVKIGLAVRGLSQHTTIQDSHRKIVELIKTRIYSSENLKKIGTNFLSDFGTYRVTNIQNLEHFNKYK